MRNSGAAAAAYMRDLARNGASGVKGMCLKTCRLAWGLPADEPSAIEEWRSIPLKHRHSDKLTAAVGAPHFWGPKNKLSGRFGHVAIQAEHEGFVWTTDLPTPDRVGLVHIDLISKRWGMPYLGWSSQFQNQILPLGKEAPKESAA